MQENISRQEKDKKKIFEKTLFGKIWTSHGSDRKGKSLWDVTPFNLIEVPTLWRSLMSGFRIHASISKTEVVGES